jgi:hypothetical protein
MLDNRIRNRSVKFLALFGLVVLTVADARAGYTPVAPCTYDSELGHAAILSHAYGGDFAANGLDFSNGSITAMRCDDTGSGYADQCWTAGLHSARALARFGGFEQSLGVVHGESGGSAQTLFTVVGTGLNVSGSVDDLDCSGKAFRFARGGGGELFTSFDDDNTLGYDQMISYRVTGPNGLDRYVLFFEDASAAQNSDWDFNDLVVEIDGASPHAVPLPAAVWSGLAMLMSGGLWNARARVRARFE